MIKAPSQQFEYTLIFSGDPSLELPAGQEERAKALEVARETGQWAALIRSGETPTLFHVRPLNGGLLDWFISESTRRGLSDVEVNAFALRCALRRVEGFGEHKVEFEACGHDREFRIAKVKIIDAIYAVEGVGREVVQELGDLVWRRAVAGLPPKS